MSDNSVKKYIGLIEQSMSMTNEVEKNKIINEAHQVLRNSKPNTGYIHTGSHNSTMYQTNVYCGPVHPITEPTFDSVYGNLPLRDIIGYNTYR